MAVSACEPQPLEEQSRGVPSATVRLSCQPPLSSSHIDPETGINESKEQGEYDLPVRPGISTPLAPVTLVTTPWAETEAARQATATEVEERILNGWKEVVVTVSNRSRVCVVVV